MRFDAYVGDGSGRVFDVEMQRSNAPDLMRRARYYQSSMDIAQLKRGMRYGDLPDSHAVFFCTFDPFGRGLRRYTYRRACAEDSGGEPWDGTQFVFLNPHGTDGEVNVELQGVLDYLSGNGNDGGGLVQNIKGAVNAVLSDDRRRREFVMFELKLMDAREEGRKEGRKEGREEGENSLRTKVARLAEELDKTGRSSELIPSLSDKTRFEQLLKEFGIE